LEILILKTNINSKIDFKKVSQLLSNSFKINECTVDLGDIDKVLRVVGNELKMDDVINRVKDLGYNCEDLTY
jgi:hypothetical protein